MVNASAKFALTVILLFCVAFIGKAQENEEEVVRVRTDLVTVPAIVKDAKGRRVFGLQQSDFRLKSDNKTVKVDFFSTGTAHIALAFLLDASGSARDYLSRQRDTALSLFARFGPGSRVAVLRFDDRLEIAAQFTTSIQLASKGFQFPAGANRRTAILDAAMGALRVFDNSTSLASERRIIILTSDGLDTASSSKASEVIRTAQEHGISFYVIHFPIFSPRDGRLMPRSPVKGFRDLAEKTGGRYFIAGTAKDALVPSASYDLTPIFKAIEEDLAGQYLLGFYPADEFRDGRLHRLGLDVNARTDGKLKVSVLREGFVLSAP